jgi:magnesium transporter
MPRLLKKRSLAKGTQPGSLILIGQKKQEKVRIRLMKYDSQELSELECQTLDEAYSHIDDKGIAWINIDGIHDPELMAAIGTKFGVSQLMLEDFMNTDHRPKFEDEGQQISIITKLLRHNKDSGKIEADQLSIMAGPNYVLTLQEVEGTHFEAVRNRIRRTKNRSRIIYPDYLAYALVDCMVDNYMEIIGEIGDLIEQLDIEVLQHSGKETINKLYTYRTEMNFLRRVLKPTKEISIDFYRSDSHLIREGTREFIKDLNDHITHSIDAVDSYQLMILDQMNIYNASISNRANEIMKTLTIFASIFIPLTFVAGIYGMNFEIIPELKWRYGYMFFWILILLIGGGFFLYFRKKKWF